MKMKILLSGLAFILIFSSCKKDTVLSNSNLSQSVTSKTKADLKKWFDSHATRNNLGSREEKDSFDLPEQLPIWDSIIYYPGDSTYTTPLTKQDIGDAKIIRYLVLQVGKSGEIESGEYTFIKISDANDNLTLEEILDLDRIDLLNFDNMPDHFKASMIKFGLDGVRKYGKKVDHSIVSEIPDQYKSLGRVADPEGTEGGFCIDHWWITYIVETGEIISIDYDGTTCYGTGGGGGGGGGTPGGCRCPLTLILDITTLITDPCWLSVYNQINNAGLQNIASQFMQSESGNQNVSLTFVQGVCIDQFGNETMAQSQPVGSSGSAFVWNIRVDPNYSGNASREAMGISLIHELLHTYLTQQSWADGTLPNPLPQTLGFSQHQTMFYGQINVMTQAMQEIFGLSQTDARACALSGMDDALKETMSGPNYGAWKPAFNQFAIQNYGTTLAAAEIIADKYIDGTKGHVCDETAE